MKKKFNEEESKIILIIFLIIIFLINFIKSKAFEYFSITISIGLITLIIFILLKKIKNKKIQQEFDSIIIKNNNNKIKQNKTLQEVQEKIHKEQIGKQNQKIDKQNKQNFEDPYKSLYRKSKESNYQKGKNYEKQIGKYFESLDYYVIYHGIKMGKKDKGIDIIAIKENEALFIQCKNWTNSKIKQKHIKEFIGSCYTFLEKNPNYKNKKIKQIFITSNNKIDYGVKKFIEENNKIIEYKIIPYKNA